MKISLKRSMGWIYVLSNESMPGLYKVGKTENSPSARAAELSSATGVPTSFHVLYAVQTVDCHSAEKSIHSKLDKFRVNPRREFFRTRPEEIIEVVSQVAYRKVLPWAWIILALLTVGSIATWAILHFFK